MAQVRSQIINKITMNIKTKGMKSKEDFWTKDFLIKDIQYHLKRINIQSY